MIAISLWLGWGGVEVGNASQCRGRNNTCLCAERVKVRLLVLAVVCCFVALSGQSYLPTAFKWILWRSPGIMIIIIWPLLITLLWPGRDKKDDYKSWRWASGGILFERERERFQELIKGLLGCFFGDQVFLVMLWESLWSGITSSVRVVSVPREKNYYHLTGGSWIRLGY